MSIEGIKVFADVMSVMQRRRNALLRGDNQDIRLAQLLHEAKEAVVHEFALETLKVGGE